MSLRRPTVALLLFTFDISPLCDVTQTSDCGTYCRLYPNISPLCGVPLTPDCGLVNLFYFFFLSRRHFRHSIGLQYFIGISGGLPPDFLFTCHEVQILLSECALLICSCASCLHLLYLMSKLSCEYFHSTHLAC